MEVKRINDCKYGLLVHVASLAWYRAQSLMSEAPSMLG
jgi:hypothetical protein